MYAGYYYGIENNCVVEHMAVYDYFGVILYAWIHFIVIGLLLFFFFNYACHIYEYARCSLLMLSFVFTKTSCKVIYNNFVVIRV